MRGLDLLRATAATPREVRYAYDTSCRYSADELGVAGHAVHRRLFQRHAGGGAI